MVDETHENIPIRYPEDPEKQAAYAAGVLLTSRILDSLPTKTLKRMYNAAKYVLEQRRKNRS